MPKPGFFLICAILIAEVLSLIEITMFFAALRVLVEEFGGPDKIGWAVTGFLLVSAVSAALFGRLGDMYNRKSLLLVAIALSVLGSLIAGFSSTLTGVIIGRCVQGVAGGIFPLCIGILRENIDKQRLPVFIGFLSAVMTISAGLGLYVGGIIVDYLTWHWIFFVTAMVGVVAWIAVYWAVPIRHVAKPDSGTNYVGGLLFAPAVACLLLAFTRINSEGTVSNTMLLIIAGLVLGVAWVVSELKADKPLLNLRLLLQREILLTNLATVFFAMAWMQFGQIWSLLLQQPTETGVGLGLSASTAGLVMQPQTLMALVGGPVAGWFVVKYGVRASGVVGATILALAWASAVYKHDTIAFVIVLMLTMGFSSSFLVTVMVSSVAKTAPPHQTGEAIGMLALVRAIANSVGAIIVFYLLSVSTVVGPDGRGVFPSASDYSLTMMYCAAGTLLIGLIYGLGYPRSKQRTRPATAFKGTLTDNQLTESN